MFKFIQTFDMSNYYWIPNELQIELTNSLEIEIPYYLHSFDDEIRKKNVRDSFSLE